MKVSNVFKHCGICWCVIAEVCFVLVYRSVDNSVPPVLGVPCSLEDCHSPPQPNNSSLSQSPVKPMLVGRAFAGPMSPAMVRFVNICMVCVLCACVCIACVCYVLPSVCACVSVEHEIRSRT